MFKIRKMERNVIFYIIFWAFVTSCSIDDYGNEAVGGDLKVLNTPETDVQIFSFDEFENINSNSIIDTLDRFQGLSTKGFIGQGVKGFSRKLVRKTIPKMKFYKSDADKIGVDPNKIYTVQYLTIEVDIDTEGKLFVSMGSPYCGGTPVANDKGEEISNFDHMGYRVVTKGNPTTLSTHLIYVDCTFPQGEPIYKYYPRRPQDLEWNFNLY